MRVCSRTVKNIVIHMLIVKYESMFSYCKRVCTEIIEIVSSRSVNVNSQEVIVKFARTLSSHHKSALHYKLIVKSCERETS